MFELARFHKGTDDIKACDGIRSYHSNDLATCETNITDWTKNASEILQQLDETQDINDEDKEEVDDTTSNPTVSREEALTNLSILRTYFHLNCTVECLEHLQSIEKTC